ncbi:carboxy terminal-processing peptidase [Vibrio lentus]|nr:carboxy terminal-processing peptidase [Vibrio lentus]
MLLIWNFSFHAQDIEKYKADKDDNDLSLNEKVRQQESDDADVSRPRAYQPTSKAAKLEVFKTLDDIPKDHEAPDAYLDESVAIMPDMIAKRINVPC